MVNEIIFSYFHKIYPKLILCLEEALLFLTIDIEQKDWLRYV